MDSSGETTAPEPSQDLTGRERFLAACACRALDRPPIWLMRQAGRALPEYRALKEKQSFLELVRTPELAAEVTLQPIHRFGFDAAIIFSDILVVPEAMGQPYRFREQGGIQMASRLDSVSDLEKLDDTAVPERLAYVSDALRSVRKALGGKTALIGFAGSPWTLAGFMIEGGSSRDFARTRRFYKSDASAYGRLAAKLTRAVAAYLRMQLDAGVDAIQIFDTLGGLLDKRQFYDASARWMREIISELGGRVPAIVFSKGVHDSWDTLARTGANVVGVDWNVRLSEVRSRLPDNVAVQGNLRPSVLTETPDQVRAETLQILEDMRGARGHVFNLGHGVPPDARLENIAVLVDTVRGFA